MVSFCISMALAMTAGFFFAEALRRYISFLERLETPIACLVPFFFFLINLFWARKPAYWFLAVIVVLTITLKVTDILRNRDFGGDDDEDGEDEEDDEYDEEYDDDDF